MLGDEMSVHRFTGVMSAALHSMERNSGRVASGQINLRTEKMRSGRGTKDAHLLSVSQV